MDRTSLSVGTTFHKTKCPKTLAIRNAKIHISINLWDTRAIGTPGPCPLPPISEKLSSISNHYP